MREKEMNRMQYGSVTEMVAIARRWWWMFCIPIAVAIAVAVAITARQQPVYEAEAEVIIRTEESANLFPLSEMDTLHRSPSAEEGFLASTAFETSAFAAAGSVGEVWIDVGDVNSRVEPSFIRFRATANSPEVAASAAQAWADTYIAMRHERDTSDLFATIETLESRLAVIEDERSQHLAPVHALDRTLQVASDSGDVSILSTQRLVLLQSIEPSLAPLDEQAKLVTAELAQLRLVEDFLGGGELSARVNRTAEAPAGPISPSVPRNIAFALLIGLGLGVGAVLLAETLDDRVRSLEEVSRRLGLQSLATIPYSRRDDESPVSPVGPIAESYHRLASAIDFCSITETRAQVLVFTSAQAAVAKTTTVSRLGTTLARQGRRTLIIGGDLRLPSLAGRFGDKSGPGLGEVLGGLYSFADCVTEVPDHDGLSLLRAGTVATEASPVDLLRTEALAELIEGLRPHYDHILIDSPPLLPVVDALEILRACDGVILNLFAGRSRLGRAERAMSMIVQASRKPVLGFVMTGTKSSDTDAYSGGYYGRDRALSELVDLRRQRTLGGFTSEPALVAAPTSIQSPAEYVASAIGQSSMPVPQVTGSSNNDDEIVVRESEHGSLGTTKRDESKPRKMRALRNLLP